MMKEVADLDRLGCAQPADSDGSQGDERVPADKSSGQGGHAMSQTNRFEHRIQALVDRAQAVFPVCQSTPGATTAHDPTARSFKSLRRLISFVRKETSFLGALSRVAS